MTLSRHFGLLVWAPLQDALEGVERTSHLGSISGDGSTCSRHSSIAIGAWSKSKRIRSFQMTDRLAGNFRVLFYPPFRAGGAMFPMPDRRRDHAGLRRPNPGICLECTLAPACPMVFPQCLGNHPASPFGFTFEGKIERREPRVPIIATPRSRPVPEARQEA
jgi:hypothetical protein